MTTSNTTPDRITRQEERDRAMIRAGAIYAGFNPVEPLDFSDDQLVDRIAATVTS